MIRPNPNLSVDSSSLYDLPVSLLATLKPSKFKLLHSLSVLTTMLILLVHSYIIILGL